MVFSSVHVGQRDFQTNPIHSQEDAEGAEEFSFDELSAVSANSCNMVWEFGRGCAALSALRPPKKQLFQPIGTQQKLFHPVGANAWIGDGAPVK